MAAAAESAASGGQRRLHFAIRGGTPITQLVTQAVTSIGDAAFFGWGSLTSLEIPLSVTSIESGAFEGCSSLESLTISSSIPIIMGNAFAGCTKFATLAVFRPYAGGRAACTAPTVHKTAFENCPNINVVSAPDVVVEAFGPPMKLHRNTDRLSARQRAWVKHLLTVRSRIRLHWKPVNKGPRSVSCTPTPEHPPLPRVMNDIWLLVLKFVTLAELGDLNT
eukprot:gene32557-biopygen11440